MLNRIKKPDTTNLKIQKRPIAFKVIDLLVIIYKSKKMKFYYEQYHILELVNNILRNNEVAVLNKLNANTGYDLWQLIRT